MELFRIKHDIPFMRHAKVFNVISFLTFAAAVFFLLHRGLNLSVEFTGGVLVEARYTQAADLEKIRNSLVGIGIAEPQVQNFGTSRDVLIRLAVKDLQNGEIGSNGKLNNDAMTSKVLVNGGPDVKLMRVEFVGPQVGRELAENGVIALMIVIIGIMIYLALRFEWKFAVSAIIANLHDVVIILGFFALFQWEFSLSVLAAVLAVLGYSVNESVVVFDRIRETFKKSRRMSVPETIDNAITRTISRTIITHGSTQIMVCSMLFFGGPTLHYFAVALTIGICFGIYSSVLVASPLVMWLGLSREDLVKPVKKDKEFETP
ncbi:protein translocase subunit SecF [Limnobacter humi]|uniref:Protein-export membrane protein SecF n=1 Tax=Limnobacter humi TaxID=1778671 RepID=A0ABT1WCC9_9BURK|nr:protein translocase subunit SecF [Limnobacter humi]MCQ8895171.1 protein translocase subunit SecF [Limnobacter humi]